MTASETGRETPAAELVDRLRFRAGRYRAVIGNDIFYGRAEATDDEAAADLIEAQAAIMADRAARIASLEAERARMVEAYRVGVEETCREWAPPEDWSDAELTQQGLDARKRAAWVKKEMMKDWRVARALAIASEKGGQADG